MRKLEVIGIEFMRSILPPMENKTIKKINIDYNIAKIFSEKTKIGEPNEQTN